MNILYEYRKTLVYGEVSKWEKLLAKDCFTTSHAVRKWCRGTPPSPKHAKLIIKSKHCPKGLTLHSLRPDIW